MFAVMVASSSRVAGRIFFARRVAPAPMMWAGLAGMSPPDAAVPRMVRRSA